MPEGLDGKPTTRRVKRNEIPFDATKATALAKLFDVIKVKSDDEDESGERMVFELAGSADVSQYVPTTSESKFVEERAKLAEKRVVGPEAVTVLATKVGYAGAVDDDEAFVRAIRDYIKSIRAGL